MFENYISFPGLRAAEGNHNSGRPSILIGLVKLKIKKY
jgi:hypothetical protein